jgi:hypothetical protein
MMVWRVVEYAAPIGLMIGVLWFAARLLRVPSTLAQHPGRRPLGERSIPVERIIGSVDAGRQLFDRQFRPSDVRSQARFESVYVAMRTGERLPSIDVFHCRGDYFVSDGLHRVAVARALGQDYLPAEVTEIVA